MRPGIRCSWAGAARWTCDVVAQGSYWWPDHESMTFMVGVGFMWNRDKLCFERRDGHKWRRIAQYTDWAVSGELQWEWAESTLTTRRTPADKIGEAGFDSPITAFVNAELAGWKV